MEFSSEQVLVLASYIEAMKALTDNLHLAEDPSSPEWRTVKHQLKVLHHLLGKKLKEYEET